MPQWWTWEQDRQWASSNFHRSSNSKWFESRDPKNPVKDKIHMDVRDESKNKIGDLYITVTTDEMYIRIAEV